MVVDLHLHSDASDGTETPSELMRQASTAGVGVAALTDHDTLAGLQQAATTAHELGIELINGVELSVDHDDVKMHMLVYFVDPGGPFEAALEPLRRGRHIRNAEIVARLNGMGYAITIDDVERQAGGASVGRPHIADALIALGRFSSRDEVFETLLHDGGPAYVERSRMSATEAISRARDIAAVPVIAHPATIRLPEAGYGELFRTLTDRGLGGIEAHHSMHSPALRARLVDIADELGIAATGGSDFHGEGKRPYRIGRGRGDLSVPMAAVDALEAQRGR